MKLFNKLVLRKRVGSFYAEHLPTEIHYRNRAGEDVSVPTENATVDELAFALQLASEEQSTVSRRRAAIEDLYQNARKSGALGADRMTDIDWKA
jgi:hypothetical protein